MKRVWTAVLVITAILGMLIIGCSKKKNIVLTPSDFGTATTVSTNVNTVTQTNTIVVGTSTFTATRTITQTDTPYAGTSTSTFTITATRTRTVTPTRTMTLVVTPTFTATATMPKPFGWIDDMEDPYAPNANDFTLGGPVLNGGGYWITYDDNSSQNNGTSYVWPETETYAARMTKTAGPFEVSAPGCPDSPGFAARISGVVSGCSGGAGSWWLDTTCSLAGITTYYPPGEDHAFRFGFFGMGTQLTPTAGEGNTDDGSGNLIDVAGDCQEVDLSPYTGIRFWVMGDGTQWRMKMPYSNQINCDGKNGTLAEKQASNYSQANDIGHTWTPTAGVWEQKTILFNTVDMTHESWGYTCSAPGGPTTCDLTTVLQHVKQIQFQTFGDPSAANCYPVVRELWIDNIELLTP